MLPSSMSLFLAGVIARTMSKEKHECEGRGIGGEAGTRGEGDLDLGSRHTRVLRRL